MNSRIISLFYNKCRKISHNYFKYRYKYSRSSETYLNFMFSESYNLSDEYLKNNVIIHNTESIEKCNDSGAIIAFIHYGSFFLSGSALVSQLNCKFTLIASLSNQSGNQKDKWRSFHFRFNKSYSSNIILNTDYLKGYIKLLKSNYFIGIALDVHTNRKNRDIKKFKFINNDLYLDDYVSSISQRFNKIVIATNIFYDFTTHTHHLFLSDPFYPDNYTTRESLSFISKHIYCESQFFHDLNKLFSSPKLFR